jgi:hypothetical protein
MKSREIANATPHPASDAIHECSVPRFNISTQSVTENHQLVLAHLPPPQNRQSQNRISGFPKSRGEPFQNGVAGLAGEIGQGGLVGLSRAMENCPLGVTRNCPLLGITEERANGRGANHGKPVVE